MSTGVLAGQIVLVFAIAALGVSIATQWTAAALGYQVRLGAPWFLRLRYTDVLPVAPVPVVVLLQRVRSGHLSARRRHCRLQRHRERGRRGRCIGLALQTIEVDHDLRVRALGYQR